jgi:hypothetical protein
VASSFLSLPVVIPEFIIRRRFCGKAVTLKREEDGEEFGGRNVVIRLKGRGEGRLAIRGVKRCSAE